MEISVAEAIALRPKAIDEAPAAVADWPNSGFYGFRFLKNDKQCKLAGPQSIEIVNLM